MSNKIKGNILEDLVAMMHQVPGVRVQKRRKLPVLRSKTKRKREIDVLITSSVAGYKVQIALGCKNEATALKTSAVAQLRRDFERRRHSHTARHSRQRERLHA